jgi:hypothetical protein
MEGKKFMNLRRFLGAAAVLAVFCGVSAALQPCAGIKIRSSVEVEAAGLSLAEVLAPGTCPEVRRAAALIRLGDPPLPGSVRVIEGDDVRQLIERLLEQLSEQFPEHTRRSTIVGTATTEKGMQVPERIMVRRAGRRMSCAEITQVLGHALRSGVADPGAIGSEVTGTELSDRGVPALGNFLPQELDCTSALRVPYGAPLKLTKQFWDPALHNWEYSLRCVHPSDCVPFLIRARGTVAQDPKTVSRVVRQTDSRRPTSRNAAHGPAVPLLLRSSHSLQKSQPGLAATVVNQSLLVRPGETVTLTWEEAGIRLVLPVTCLDRGGLGQEVRARIKTGGRVLRAEVVGEGKLRAAL